MIKYVFFDVAGTLLYKPTVFTFIQQVLLESGYEISLKDIKLKHKALSETTEYPDRTNKVFYEGFNTELLRLLGVVPSAELAAKIYQKCTYLPWVPYEDTDFLKSIQVPMGIVSNFNNTLKDKINTLFGDVFEDIHVSEELGLRKPNVEFYRQALDKKNLDPNQVLYVGDSLKLDIEPASKLGIKALLIDREGFYCSSPFRIQSLYGISEHYE